MSRTRRIWTAAVVCLAAAFAPGRAWADPIVAYELLGQPGNQATFSPTTTATGVAGLDMTRGSGLTTTTAANTFTSTGWNSLDPSIDYVQFGFNVDSGYVASVDQFYIATRTSATGPGSVNVNISVDGGAFTTFATLTQTTNDYVNTLLNLNLTVYSSLVIRFVVNLSNPVAANGGAIGSGGTFRISDYYDSSTQVYTATSFTGSVTATAVPEPSSIVLLGLAPLGVLALRARLARSRR
ncbi:PEP-CTERM sorting domain-containing protein [Paludisphaera rhizosphaerae]|uniref:PEP-CTERM sorting domain-containing protein n=1 Tax=Paludisphaera rhizosphaerae TaxID=2711216 RepID=UPI0013EC1909|nr:PEP-CTERM sorting domain-containing protein [Paludisphaera rhizosphaerae]